MMRRAVGGGISPSPPPPPRFFVIICKDQQRSRMHGGRDLTGWEGLIGLVTSLDAHTRRSRSLEAHRRQVERRWRRKIRGDSLPQLRSLLAALVLQMCHYFPRESSSFTVRLNLVQSSVHFTGRERFPSCR